MTLFELLGHPFFLSKSVHALSAVLFLGNFFVGTWWLWFGWNSKNLELLRFAYRGVLLSDVVLSGLGSTLVFASGVFNLEIVGMPFHANFFALWGAIFFVLSNLIWWICIVPIQISHQKQLREARSWSEINGRFRTLLGVWFLAKGVIVVLLSGSLLLMVLKPDSFA